MKDLKITQVHNGYVITESTGRQFISLDKTSVIDFVKEFLKENTAPIDYLKQPSPFGTEQMTFSKLDEKVPRRTIDREPPATTLQNWHKEIHEEAEVALTKERLGRFISVLDGLRFKNAYVLKRLRFIKAT